MNPDVEAVCSSFACALFEREPRRVGGWARPPVLAESEEQRLNCSVTCLSFLGGGTSVRSSSDPDPLLLTSVMDSI